MNFMQNGIILPLKFFRMTEEIILTKTDGKDIDIMFICNPMGSCIVDGSEYPTQSKCLQCAFDNIDMDLREMENMVSEKSQLIQDGDGTEDNIKEVEYWLSEMKY